MYAWLQVGDPVGLLYSSNAIGIVTHSSGNHGQAVAYASSIASLPSFVVVTENTPKVKVSV